MQLLVSKHIVTEHEAEAASNSYLMSLIAIICGLPLPIVNLIATVIFYFGNRKSTWFVRWHCTQALLSQLSLFLMNSYGFWWSIAIAFTEKEISALKEHAESYVKLAKKYKENNNKDNVY